MRASKLFLPIVVLLMVDSTAVVFAQSAPPQPRGPAATVGTPAKPMSDAEKAEMAERVRAATLHAWNGYKKYAWGHDALKPLTLKPFDWYGDGHSLLMTPVDALDTLTLMGLKDQADDARKLIDTKLNLDQDIYVKDFEITIRLLGSLISCYEMTGDKRLLELADELGRRMSPMFDSPTGMPYEYVNLHTGAVRGTKSNPAEIGTLLDRIRDAGAADGQAELLRHGQARGGGTVQAAFDRSGWWGRRSMWRRESGPIRRRASWAGSIRITSIC